MKLNSIPKRSKTFAWRIVGGEALLVPLHSKTKQESISIFNGTATSLWELVNGKNTVGDIIGKTAVLYQGNPGVIKRQTIQLLDQLYRKKMIIL